MFKTKSIIAVVFVVLLMFVELPDLFAQVDQPVGELPVLSVMPEVVDFGVLEKTATGGEFIEISSRGQGKIRWIVKRTEPWLVLDVYSGVVGDDVELVLVTADPSDLSPGHHQAEIAITSSSGTRTIPVSIIVLPDDDDMFIPELEKINLDAVATATQVGRKIYLGAVGVYSDGSKKDITKEINWVSKNKRVGYFVDEGLFIGKHTGDVSVFAKKGRVRSPVITIHVDALDGPLLKVSLPKIKLDHMEKGSVEDIPMTLRNAGKGELEWEIISMAPWLVLNGGISSDDAGRQMADEEDLEFAGAKEDVSDEWKSVYSRLHGIGAKKVEITVDTTELQDGRHEGTILVRSNGGDQKITVPVKIRSLESISLTPVSVRTTVNHKTMFRSTGIWSDGSRTDLSKGSGGMWIISDPSIGFFPRGRSVFVARNTGTVEIRRVRGDVSSNVAVVDVEEDVTGPVLLVSPREVDFGTIGPGESSKGVISLKNVGSGNLTWMVNRMGAWISPSDGKLSETVGMSTSRLRVSIESVADDGVSAKSLVDDEVSTEPMVDDGASVDGLSDIRIKFETRHKTVFYKRRLSPGNYREELKISFNGGERTVFLKFIVAEKEGTRSSMDIRPLGIDFGSVDAGRKLIKRVELRNAGENILKWKAMLQGNRKTFRGVVLERGRYVSFANEAVSEKGSYSVPGRLKNELYISGEWSEKGGYPYGTGDNKLLKYTFFGKGIVLFLWKDVYGGILDLFVDNQLVGQIDCASEKKERIEFPVVESLAEGEPHLLILAARGGSVGIEGVRIYTSELMKGKKGWIRISPEKGTTTNEVDYINVMVNTGDMSPGSYSENILFYSSEGTETVEVSLDIRSDKASELIDIYRYTKGTSSLLSPDVAREGVSLEGYKKSGPAFRLFHKDTPGTTEFFQWHNPSEATHFYSYSRSGGKHSLRGYIFDGSIGNIATLKLPHTRDLYRWFNPETRAYFYTTDPKGEGREKMGYIYDGVAGYVR
ncbi:MAG: hypothetical protein J7K35_05730 [Syntrophobacterales bacterium]|nr:hypothetical protein [Syntrophobacterales bacterium]